MKPDFRKLEAQFNSVAKTVEQRLQSAFKSNGLTIAAATATNSDGNPDIYLVVTDSRKTGDSQNQAMEAFVKNETTKLIKNSKPQVKIHNK